MKLNILNNDLMEKLCILIKPTKKKNCYNHWNLLDLDLIKFKISIGFVFVKTSI